MDLPRTLPLLLGLAWLLPLASFTLIVLFGPRMGKHGRGAGLLATAAIVGACVLSMIALVGWIGGHGTGVGAHEETSAGKVVEQSEHGPVSEKAYYAADWYTLA